MYQTLDPKQTTELVLVRHGWFNPEYELTDKVNSYGKITYHRFSPRKATATTATGTWIFRRAGLFNQTIFITDQNDSVIGKATRDWFSRITILTLQTGFRAQFYRPEFFSREYIWESDGYGKILEINSYPLRLKDKININQSMAPPALIPLLTFLGSYLIILKRRRQAGH
jgi:hypothetical protein